MTGDGVRPQHISDVFVGDDGKVLMKLLQRDSACALLLQKDADFHVICASFVYPLQCSDRSTAECLGAMLREDRPSSAASDTVGRRVRLATTDAFSGNSRAERLNGSWRRSWHWIGIFCQLHKLATGQERTTKTCVTLISWLVSTAKSLEPAGEMARLRNVFRKNVRHNFVRLDAPVAKGSEAMAWKNYVIDLCLGTKRG